MIYMSKKHVMISIEEDIHKKAQDKFINISGVAEDAIREKLSKKEVTMTNPTKCELCGIEGVQETKETVNKSSTGLTWLYPDEIWICNRCLKGESRFILK